MKIAFLSILLALCTLMLCSCNGDGAHDKNADGDYIDGDSDMDDVDGDLDDVDAAESREAEEEADPPQCSPPLVPVGRGCEALKIPELDAQWQRINTGGETSCARGTPFYFYVRGGKVNRLLVSFRGGGACWSAGTCALNEKDMFFVDSIEEEHDPTLDDDGIFDLDNPENPFADWYIVHVP